MEFPYTRWCERIILPGDIVTMNQAWVDSLRNLQPVWGFESERPTCRVVEVGDYFTLLEGVGADAGVTAWVLSNKLALFIE